MYDRLRRRGDLKLAGPRARQELVDAHVGDRQDFLRRHVEATQLALAEGGEALAELAARLPARIADTRTLRLAWDQLRDEGGASPGPNGLTYEDLEEDEVWEWIRYLGERTRNQTYRAGPTRRVTIPKASGEGKRQLELPDVWDRVVAKSALLVLQPLLDPTFDDDSYGFRPGRNPLEALARAKSLAFTEDRRTWLKADILDAFGAVPTKRMLDALRRRVPSERTTHLVQAILGTPRKRGIPQGNPLSPLLLNVYLDHGLDRRWRKQHPSIPLLRYADDLLLPCRDDVEAHQAREALVKMTREIGMSLSASKTRIERLDSPKGIDWLGFRLRLLDEEFTARTSEEGWRNLQAHLAETHRHPGSPLRAQQVLDGWFGQQGPAYDPRVVQPLMERVQQILSDLYLEEALDRTRLTKRWREGRDRWRLAQADAQGTGDGRGTAQAEAQQIAAAAPPAI